MLLIIVAIILVVPLSFNYSDLRANAQETPANDLVKELSDLDKQMQDKKKEIEALKNKSDAYKKQIEEAERKATSLETELAILSNKTEKIKLDIEAAEKKIEEIDLEIKNLELQIADNEAAIAKDKDQISEFLRLIYRNDQKSYLAVLIANKSFSEFYDQAKYAEELQSDLQGVLNQVQELKAELEARKREREDKKTEVEKSKEELASMQGSLEDQMASKEVLLSETFASERQFQNWLLQSKYEEDQLSSEITNIDRNIRQKLEESDKSFSSDNGSAGSLALSWPVDHARGISATFHDPDYPFRYIFEHPAIDLRAYQGTPVGAAAPGYVAKVKNGGLKGYSYIMLIHANGISTVYGHISKIMVQEDTYVLRGQTIGLSGGMPGTPGAGPLTTGPHLHFEVRLDGIPVNPLNYLP